MMLLTAGSAIASASLSRSKPTLSQTPPQIAIIGGGIAGLNAAYQLQKQGHQATVYEASDRLGGRIFTQENVLRSGQYLDWGGAYVNSDHDDILALIDDFGLSVFDIAAAVDPIDAPATAYHLAGEQWTDDKLVDLLRPLAEKVMADAERLDTDFARYAPALDQLSVSDYLQERTDSLVLTQLMANIIRSEYGVEPEQSSALQLLFSLPMIDPAGRADMLGNSDEAYFIQGGSGQVIQSLGQALRSQIQYRKPLVKLTQMESTWQLTFADRSKAIADYVILAIPMPTLRQVELQADLPERLRRFIQDVDLGRDEKLFCRFSQRIWQRPDGFAADMWFDGNMMSVLWDSSIRIPGQVDGTLTCFYGGQQAVELQRNSTRDQGRLALELLEQAIPGIQGVATHQFIRTNWAEQPYTLGAYTNFRPGQLTEFADFFYIEAEDPAERQEVSFSRLVFAGEQFSDAYYGYMNGGAQTGRLAVEVLLRYLQD
jgi:monoamine oxidase